MSGLPAGPLFLFLKRFALDTEGCDRAGFEPLVGNVLTALLADAVGLVLHPTQGFIDLLEQFLFAFHDPHGKALIFFCRRLITHIR